MKVIVLYGPTGTGKSKWVLDNYNKAYWKQKSIWWDNYNQQEAVVLDEYYGWLPYDFLLRLCDRYPLLCEIKGGQLQFTSKTIIFTTNLRPDKWYKDGCYFDAFIRRVSEWHYLPTLETHTIDINYNEFFNKIRDAPVYLGNQGVQS